MEITDEQRRRSEANRLAALEKRKRLASAPPDAVPASWRLTKCPSLPPPTPEVPNNPTPPRAPARFLVALEITSPDEFSAAPKPLPDHPFPGCSPCLQSLNACLFPVMPLRTIETEYGLRASVYKLRDYELVLRCVKKLPGVQLQDIPYATRAVVQKFSHCVGDVWDPVPNLPGFCSDEEVEGYMMRLPKLLRDALLPFQVEGVRFGLRRGGKCLIADEMGLGKTIQAIAIACCFMDQGPLLIVCPAVLRFSWAEELEHWLPFLLPKDIHLVFGHSDSLDRLERSPRVVVISYTMLNRLRKSMLNREWALIVIDESHNIRCTKKSESEETKAVLEVAATIPRIILLSGTPSLSRPYDIYHQINMLWPHMLGKGKYEFAKNYCSMRLVQGCQGKKYMDFSKGTRLEELNVLLRQTLMIRRLKEHVLTQLPAKRRQIIRLKLNPADILLATASYFVDDYGEHQDELEMEDCLYDFEAQKPENPSPFHGDCNISTRQLSHQEIGIAKLSGFRKWFSNLGVVTESKDAAIFDMDSGLQKMLIFAHHLKVLDGVQEFICEKGITFVRIDGSTLPRDRQAAVEAFRLSKEVKVAIIGITAGGVGLDFSSAQNVVFLELPRSASEMLQAEDRAHRRGQNNAVNIYIFCATDTSDESHWLHLNKSLFCVSSMMNGNVDAIKEIEVDRVFYLDHTSSTSRDASPEVKGGMQAVKDYSDTSDVSDGSAAEHSDAGNCSVQKEPINCEADTACDVMPIDADGGSDEEAEADANTPNESDLLRFEVSQYTRRVHLYICMQEKDSRPRPLFENFRPEELDSVLPSAADTNTETTLHILKENPTYYSILQKFIKEWNALRPIEQNKLLGKPLQLPLKVELCYLKETINHGYGGLLKGGSRRRVTPQSEISYPLPENAVWKKVILRGGTGKEKEYLQAWNVNQEPLCKLCQEPCTGKLAKTPEFLEDLFCNLKCYRQYRIRTDQRALREELFQIEHGVCIRCKLDCHKLVECIRHLSMERRKCYIQEVAPKLANNEKLFDKLVREPSEGNAWHADHIIPVNNGGGECGLENMRTLCVACHYEVTMADQSEWRLRKKKEKEIVKFVLKEISEPDITAHKEQEMLQGAYNFMLGKQQGRYIHGQN